jgi:hypothetical protein
MLRQIRALIGSAEECPSTVDQDRLPTDETGQQTDEERHQVADVRWNPQPSDGHLADQPLDLFRRIVTFTEQIGVDGR